MLATYSERRNLAQRTCDEVHVATTIVIDEMDNAVRNAYGRLPNSAYITDSGGKIVFKEAWAKPAGWGDILEKVVAGAKD
ncbi:MAG: hypothetical protein ABIG68_12790 [Acidobacteriota bacterium]